MTGKPERLNLHVLVVLCKILDCTPNHLIRPVETASSARLEPARPLRPARATSSPSAPAPPPDEATRCLRASLAHRRPAAAANATKTGAPTVAEATASRTCARSAPGSSSPGTCSAASLAAATTRARRGRSVGAARPARPLGARTAPNGDGSPRSPTAKAQAQSESWAGGGAAACSLPRTNT
ncbi:MAG: helix-turn-helix domain-containing protein [Actinomycetota bacterium]|nr:helix-turn-helix domain-containing protein [Actinomycetota bacterium]